jgi:hypothetical protein
MRRGWVPLVGWGALLLFWTAAQLPFSPDAGELALLGGAGLVCVGLGGLVALLERRRPVTEDPEQDDGAPPTVPDTSAPAVMLGTGVTLFVVGLEFGPWALYLGGGIALVGLASLVRERRAERAG